MKKAEYINGQIQSDVNAQLSSNLQIGCLLTIISAALLATILSHIPLNSILEFPKPLFILTLLILSLFLFVITLVIWRNLRVYLQSKKYADTRITLDPFPGSSAKGGHIGGYVDINNLPDISKKQVVASVNCVNFHRVSHRGTKGTPVNKVIWRKQVSIKLQKIGNQSYRITFLANVDEDLPDSADEEIGDHIYWTVKITIKKTSFDQSFNIPVTNSGSPVVARHITIDT